MRSIGKSHDLGNRTHYLPVCSLVPKDGLFLDLVQRSENPVVSNLAESPKEGCGFKKSGFAYDDDGDDVDFLTYRATVIM